MESITGLPLRVCSIQDTEAYLAADTIVVLRIMLSLGYT